MALASRLLKANPSVQVSDVLTGDFTVPSRKKEFYTPLSNQYEGLVNTQVTSDSSSVTLSGLSAYDSYTVLRIMYRLRGTGTNKNGSEIYCRWNGITTATYNRGYIGFYAASDSYAEGYSTHTNLAQSTSAPIIGFCPDSVAPEGNWAYGYVDMYDAQNTNKKKSMSGQYWCMKWGTLAPTYHGLAHVSHSTTTVPSSFEISLSSGNIASGSIIQLYGFKGY